jgi:hypothetical protein
VGDLGQRFVDDAEGYLGVTVVARMHHYPEVQDYEVLHLRTAKQLVRDVGIVT